MPVREPIYEETKQLREIATGHVYDVEEVAIVRYRGKVQPRYTLLPGYVYGFEVGDKWERVKEEE